MRAFSFAARSLLRQPGRAILGIVGIAATGALLFDMLMLSRGLIVSMEQLLEGIGFDVRVMATDSVPLAGPRIADAGATVAALAALPEIDEVTPLRMGKARVDVRGRPASVAFIGTNVGVRRPWTLVRGRDLEPIATPTATPRRNRLRQGSGGQEVRAVGAPAPVLLVNRNLSDQLQLSPGAEITLRGACVADSSVPPTIFRVGGIADFPFDEASQLTAVTSLRDFARTCGDEAQDEADMLMIAARAAYGPHAAARAIRIIRPDLKAVTNEELVARFQQVEFSYFRQISFVLASITMFFGLLLITVLLSVSTNQRLGEIAALRALGFSRNRMVADVLSRSAILVGTGGFLALPLGFGLATWLDDLLRTMPGIPANLHFFVFEPRALMLHVALLAITTAIAAIYPMRTVARLPIAATLRNEVVG
jgi:putative ABC transport system permease protein